ncbi:hypothetical protein CHUAL_006771 [Chamberlinius hualienensis]
MADVNGVCDKFENESIEPGASSEAMLLVTDSYEDMYEHDENDKNAKRFDTITEIKAEFKQKNEDSNSNTNSEKEDSDRFSYDLKAVLPEDADGENKSITSDGGESIIDNIDWKMKKKHVFILSDAGKPIYSRYGNEDKLVTLMGVIQALVSCVQIKQDVIRCIVAGDHRFVFSIHRPIILVAVCSSSESIQQLHLHLTYAYYQIISVLTLTQLQKIFEQRQNYDLRRLLSGSEKFLDSVLNLVEHEPGFLLGSIRCLPLQANVRDTITQTIIQYCGKIKNLVFAILLVANQLVTLVRMKKYLLHPMDLHLVMNLVSASESFKTAESWTPICLPKFDSSGYLHGHISYLTDNCEACLLLLTVDRDTFFTLSECKKQIVQRLQRHDCIRAINESILIGGFTVSQIGIPDLRHFLYKCRSTAQYIGPTIGPPYAKDEERSYLESLYFMAHQRIHGAERPLKIFFNSGETETVVGWVTQGFELYAVLEPMITKNGAVNAVNKLLRWIKTEEDKLFILSSPTF